MDDITFARTKGARDKRRRKRRRRKFRKDVKRTVGRVVDQQLRPFRGPSRRERVVGAITTGAQVGLNLGVTAAVLAPLVKANSAALKKQLGKVSTAFKTRTANRAARKAYAKETRAWIEQTKPTPLNLQPRKK